MSTREPDAEHPAHTVTPPVAAGPEPWPVVGPAVGQRGGGAGIGADTLAVAALAVGVLACSFSWMFFIRTWIVVAGAAAALLGFAGVWLARRAGHRPTLAAAGAVLGVLAIVAVFSTEAVVRSVVSDRLDDLAAEFDSTFDSASEEPALPTEFSTPTTEESDAPTAEEGPFAAPTGAAGGGTPPPPAGDLLPNNSDAPLPVGDAGELAGFTVIITSVVTDAAETLEGGGNPPPVNGRYMLVDLSATNTGGVAGVGAEVPQMSVGLAGGDGLEYPSDSCTAFIDQGTSAPSPIDVGETTSWTVCLDTSPSALAGSSLFVGQLFATGEERAYWQLS